MNICNYILSWLNFAQSKHRGSASLWANPSQKCSRVACIVKVSHSFTCHPHVYPQMECLCLRSRSWSWDGRLSCLGTTTVSKQSAQDRYVMGITVVSCSNCHASQGSWSTGQWMSHSPSLELRATMLTTEPTSIAKSDSDRWNIDIIFVDFRSIN